MLQVITAAEFHPQQCNTFAYSSSKGAVRLVDMRSGALLEGRTKPFVCQEQLVRPCPCLWGSVGRADALWACLAAAVSQSRLAECAGWDLFLGCAQSCMGMDSS